VFTDKVRLLFAEHRVKFNDDLMEDIMAAVIDELKLNDDTNGTDYASRLGIRLPAGNLLGDSNVPTPLTNEERTFFASIMKPDLR
jgi:hypothetical protein